jgi:hypothetical protein
MLRRDNAAPRYLIRNRDGVYSHHFRNRVEGMGIQEALTAAQSPWQNPFVERLMGSIRRECLDHIIVLGERHLFGWPTDNRPREHRNAPNLWIQYSS